MNKEYKIKLDLNKKLYNKKMAFNQFDENVNDFYIEVTKNNEVVKDLDKSIVTLVAIKPNGEVDAQFIEVKEGQIYANLKPSMCDLVGNYQAKAMIVLEGEIVTTDTINYSVNEDKIISKLNDDVVSDERFTLFTDALARLSDIEASEEQRMINEAERILSEENRKIEEAKRVEAELVRQHEEADRAKYDATRESNENIRKQNESIRLANETNRIDEEAKRVEEENKRKLAEEERNANYNFMTEDEERRRSEANAHKEAEVLRVQAETDRVNEEAKRRTTEQARVSAENIRVSNENTREANEVVRQNNETQRVEAETQRQSRYNSFISDAEANANNFENYTNTAKVKEEERKANELDRKSQEARRVSNEVERISNENTRKANEVVREENEASRQDVFENKVNEVDEKISELNTTKDNFVSSVNTKVDNKISEIDSAKSDMTTTVTNKIDEVENRFNALTSKQQQDAEVIDARDGETSLKARLDRDIEKAKQVYVNVEGSNISTDSSVGYAKDVEIKGNTIQNASNLADIRSVGDKVEGQELYEIPVLSCGKNLLKDETLERGYFSNENLTVSGYQEYLRGTCYLPVDSSKKYYLTFIDNDNIVVPGQFGFIMFDENKKVLGSRISGENLFTNCKYIMVNFKTKINPAPLEKLKIIVSVDTVATEYEPYQEDKLTILSPVQLEKVGDVRDRIIEKDGVWGVEKNVCEKTLDGSETYKFLKSGVDTVFYMTQVLDDVISSDIEVICDKLPYNSSIWDNDIEGIFRMHNTIDNKLRFRISTSKGITSDVSTLKTYLSNNNMVVKYITTQPTFIPLPHSQQIKLRTFASKTNISFGCEIEGTIKAQVPKSLGATINTHTEQISNLNKELDRVKKLEESTVSTVTTESDFTTVEATSNGYFEDVKLEGKTLVNLYKNEAKTYHADYIFSPNERVNLDLFIPGNTYTAIVHNSITNFNAFRISSGDVTYDLVPLSKNTIVKFIYTPPTNDAVKNNIRCYCYPDGNKFVSGDENKISITILEGDHTQNPPSYFEGLKSVGQSATTSEADEIVVSSVKGDGNLISSECKVGTLFEVYVPKGEYVASCKSKKCTIRFYRKDKSLIDYWSLRGEETIYRTFTTPEDIYYVLFDGDENTTDIQLIKGTTPKPYTPHQSDKKRLLYYNNETQSWEKPILREWDSIEKHADGKYYYHQRSAEVVLNGSEPFVLNTQDDLTIRFSWRNVNIQNSSLVMCDKFNYSTDAQLGVESISINRLSDLYIVISKSKLSTQDVAGFKKWLQANNVTVVYQLAQEKVYECTNIDLITYANETNYVVESGAIVPKSTLKVHNNISNVVSLLQKKVSLLESNITSYMITQNRLMLASRYNADTVSFKVDVASYNNSFEYDNDLYELILNNILVGKDNYNREYIENLIIFYWMDFVISDEMYLTLFEIIEEQHNPKVIEDEAPIE